jgi:hypothetical protein
MPETTEIVEAGAGSPSAPLLFPGQGAPSIDSAVGVGQWAIYQSTLITDLAAFPGGAWNLGWIEVSAREHRVSTAGEKGGI